jgi:hypothetical protein
MWKYLYILFLYKVYIIYIYEAKNNSPDYYIYLPVMTFHRQLKLCSLTKKNVWLEKIFDKDKSIIFLQKGQIHFFWQKVQIHLVNCSHNIIINFNF